MRRHSRVHSQRRSLVQIVVAAFGICIETAGFFFESRVLPSFAQNF